MSAASTSAGGVQATASLSPASATIGDRIELTIAVIHPAGEPVAAPVARAAPASETQPEQGHAFAVETSFAPAAGTPLAAGQKLGGLEILEARPPQVLSSPDGGQETRFQYVLTTFEVGTYELPELEVQVGAGAVAKVPSQRLEVASVLPEMSGDEIHAAEIRDIKGPATVPPDYTGWVLIALGLALLVLAILLLRRYLRRPRRTVAPVVPALPPYEEAVAALDALEARRLPESGAFRELGFELSEILRRYLSRRFHVQALEATTREVMRELAGSPEAAALPRIDAAARLVRHVLEETDLFKFAKYVPPAAAGVELLGEARKLLEQTRPEAAAAGRPGPVPVAEVGA